MDDRDVKELFEYAAHMLLTLRQMRDMTAEMLEMARKNEIVIEALMRDADHDN